MENEKTLLEKIVEQKTKQITRAIEEAIESGADFQRLHNGCGYISGVLLQKPYAGQNCDAVMVLSLQSDIIREAIEEPTALLKKQREDLARQLAEIDEKLKNKKQ